MKKKSNEEKRAQLQITRQEGDDKTSRWLPSRAEVNDPLGAHKSSLNKAS